MSGVTIEGVELLEVGGPYPLSTGDQTFTQDDLLSAIAAQEDAAVKAPRLKVGHSDPRFDGEPAFGHVENMRLSENGMTLLGDLVDVPEWLAEVLPVAFPSRSIEGRFAVRTVTGKNHAFVIDALALLGIRMPGITTLEDLASRYGEEAPEGVEMGEPVTAVAAGSATRVAAATDVEGVRRSFYDTVAVGDNVWWWVRAVYVDPPEVIAEDDETGDLWRVPYKTTPSGELKWSEPQSVKVVYQNATAGVNASRRVSDADKAEASWRSRAASRPDQEEDHMGPEDIRERVGLKADASDEELAERLDALKASAEPPAEPGTPAEPAEGDEEGDEEKEGEEETPAEPAPGESTPSAVTVDASTLAELRRNAQLGADARAAQIKAERDRLVDAAVRDGRIPPARRGHWRKQLDVDPGSAEVLAKLEPGLVPVGASLGDDQADAPSGGAGEAYPASWLSARERKAIAAAQKED